MLRERLGASLPGYMVPTVFHWRESLPLTANSKIDKKALTALAAELDDAADDGRTSAPARPTERRLAAAWAKVLGIASDQIGRHDHFFDRGGSSLLGGEAGHRAGPRGVPEGNHPPAGPGRHGRA